MLTLLTITALAQHKKADDFKLSGSVAPKANGKVYLYYEKDGALKTDIAKKFNIRSIPQNILLDTTGKIIACNLRGDELSRTLLKDLNKFA